MSTAPAEEPKPTRVKSCTECRQQKLKCDAPKKGSLEPCSRCGRLGLSCVVSKSFRRVKRRTKSELQAEIDALRRIVEEGNSARHEYSSTHVPQFRDVTDNAEDLDSIVVAASTSPIRPEPIHAAVRRQENRHQSIPNVEYDAIGQSSLQRVGVDATMPQTLDGVAVSAEKIDNCFEQFLSHYLPHIPVIDVSLRPNECFIQSPFLFWTLVAIGSRKYSKDPTLILLLSPKITELARRVIITHEGILTTIQALICLCSWPMPFSTLSDDITPMLVGAMLQLAMSIGLHVYGVGQDFSRTKLACDQFQRAQRARLWALCLTVSQSANITTGLPPMYVPDTYGHEFSEAERTTSLSPRIHFLKELSQLHTQAIISIEKDALSKPSGTRQLFLDSTIDAGLLNMSQLETQTTGKLDEFQLLCARLHILCFHLFAPKGAMCDERLLALYDMACRLVEVTMDLDAEQEFIKFSPISLSKFANLAAFIILKINRSHLKNTLDVIRGQQAYFSVIQIHKVMSVQSNDIYARATLINAQLWTSSKIFKQVDGVFDSLLLRCRSRLGMSLVYDCYWWWRQEFEGKSNPYDRERDAPITNQSYTDPIDFLETGWSPQENFPFYEWAQGETESWPAPIG